MRLFGKRETESGLHPITSFWNWWSETGRDIDPRRASAATDVLSRHLEQIHPQLTWHFSKGTESRHRLTVSAGGIAAARPSAERWLRAAPVQDPTWEFRSSQQADHDALRSVLEVAGHKLDLNRLVFRVEPVEQELRVNVGVHHPRFPDLSESGRTQATFLALDWLLGEDDVERWLGHIEVLTSEPVTAGNTADVEDAVAAIAARRKPDSWTLARGKDQHGNAVMATFRRGLRWIDTPTFDRHQTITAPYDAQASGLPLDADVLQRLDRLESELVALLGARGILVGHESSAAVRTFHAYTDGEDQNLDDQLKSWARRRGLSLRSGQDPAWSQVRHLTG